MPGRKDGSERRVRSMSRVVAFAPGGTASASVLLLFNTRRPSGWDENVNVEV